MICRFLRLWAHLGPSQIRFHEGNPTAWPGEIRVWVEDIRAVAVWSPRGFRFTFVDAPAIISSSSIHPDHPVRFVGWKLWPFFC